MATNYIAMAFLALCLAGTKGDRVVIGKTTNYYHPAKVAEAQLSADNYAAKQRAAMRAEAEFWKEDYAQAERSQRSWERKEWNSADLTDKF